MSFALALKEPFDARAEAGVTTAAAAADPAAGADEAIDGAVDGAAGALEGVDDGVETGDCAGEETATGELGDSEPVPGVTVDTEGAGLDGAAKADAPFGAAAANQAVIHPW